MKIIDKKGKRIDGKASDKEIKIKLKEEDPIILNAVKDEETKVEEMSPMDPPEAYDKDFNLKMDYDQMHPNLQILMDEHKGAIEKLDIFEKALVEFKDSGFYLTQEMNASFNQFFVAFDNDILVHNRKEERGLFPLLHKRMLESGEHSDGDNPHTPVDLMEDEHVKFIQLATLTFNFLGLSMRLNDNESRAVVFDIAYNNGKELVELLRLHIFREDNTLFPLAQKLLTEEELSNING